MTSNTIKITDNHATIKEWVEERYAAPALMEGVVDDGNSAKMLRINLRDNSEGPLSEITWNQFFEIFDENNLEFQYQENDEKGEMSKFYKIINKK